MSNQRTEAEALAECLELDLADVKDAVQWADQQILAADVPHSALFDVSMASRANNLDVASMLRKVPGEIDERVVLRRLLESAATKLHDSTEARRVANALYQLAMDGTLPEGALRNGAWCFIDALDLAADGITDETPEQIIKRMRDALESELGGFT